MLARVIRHLNMAMQRITSRREFTGTPGLAPSRAVERNFLYHNARRVFRLQ